METFEANPLFYNWILALTFIHSISLVIDTIDVPRYAFGERHPRLFS